MSEIRLLLRSVYLKGQMDAHKKTVDVVSWEDNILNQILAHFSRIIKVYSYSTGEGEDSSGLICDVEQVLVALELEIK